MTSMPSKAQPPKVATSALFSFGESCVSQNTSVADACDVGFEAMAPIRVSSPQIEARDDVNGDGVRRSWGTTYCIRLKCWEKCTLWDAQSLFLLAER